ncbi:MAG: aminopeptidase P family protein [candidate division Zixibacteria bacterium]|nr:aminopeptidase P family protein [candidate division Zixibacteria bacterium]
MDIQQVQAYLKERGFDGWLLADFHGRNDVAVAFLKLTGIVTRRSFYFIPAVGEPTALVNPIEVEKFKHLPGDKIICRGYKKLESELKQLLDSHKRVAMEYSPLGRLPYIGLVEAGTIELVKSYGVEIISSADLVASFQARLTDRQIEAHHKAAADLIRIKNGAFAFIAEALNKGSNINEYDVCRFILDAFEKNELTTQFGPNCSVDANAGNPHYEPTQSIRTPIKKGQLILIDMWAKDKSADGVYGDITWMAFAGTKDEIPERYRRIFEILAKARDTAVAFLKENIGTREVYGYEVDDACRGVVEKAGFGDYFTHRTGHSITSSEHGPGPNIDNLETEDRRLLQPGHLFSIEPGIYYEDCGFRTEINVLITGHGPEVTTLPLQTEITALF